MTKRVYDFPLPYHVSGIQDAVGVGDLKSAGLWDRVGGAGPWAPGGYGYGYGHLGVGFPGIVLIIVVVLLIAGRI